jgi:Flp pilus assembly protein TadB
MSMRFRHYSGHLKPPFPMELLVYVQMIALWVWPSFPVSLLAIPILVATAVSTFIVKERYRARIHMQDDLDSRARMIAEQLSAGKLPRYALFHCCPRTPRTMAQSEANSLKTRDRTGKV